MNRYLVYFDDGNNVVLEGYSIDPLISKAEEFYKRKVSCWFIL